MQAIPTLIVDDSNMIVKIIKKALLSSTDKNLYFEEKSIYTASDGMEAFAMMGKGYPIKLIKYLSIKNTKLRTLLAYSLLWQINT